MKATYIIATIFALIGLGIVIGCQDDDLATSETSTTISADAQYMALSISMGSTSTREASSTTVEYETAGTSGIECYISASKSVLLFYGSDYNYLTYGVLNSDITSGTDDGWAVNDNNETTSIDSVVTVSVTPVSVTPSYVLCVFNYGDSWQSDLVGESYSAVKTVTTEAIPSKAGEFVISNAVINGNSTLSHLVTIEQKNLCSSEDEAKNNAVTIYVEREIAKVRIGIDSSNKNLNAIEESSGSYYAAIDTLTYKSYDKDNAATDTCTVAVTVNIKGWNVNATNSSGYVTKNYNGSESTWNTYPWYDSNFPYSLLWAVDANYTSTDGYTNGLEYLSWNDIAEGGCITDSIYIHENTAQIASSSTEYNTATKTVVTPAVVVAGELSLKGLFTSSEIDVDTLFKCNGMLYDSLAIIQLLLDNVELYTAATNGTRLAASNTALSFKRVDKDTDENAYNSGKVVVDSFYTTVNGTAYSEVYDKDGSKVNSVADALNALSWIKNGDDYMVTRYADNQCFYQALIQQISSSQDATNGPVYGVVRNNLYELTLGTISGLGNAVNDPNEEITIIPGGDSEFYMACKVYILKWVSHSQTIDF